MSGTSANDLRGGNHGTILAGAQIVPALVGNGFSFTNGTGVIDVPDAPALNPISALTLEAWIRSASLVPSYQRIVGKQRDDLFTSQYVMGISSFGGLYFGLFQGGQHTYIDGTTPLPTNTWVHVAGTWDGSVIRTYVNGIEQPQTRTFSGLVTVTAEPLRIGKGDGPKYPFNGQIDELTLYGRALPAAELAAIHALGAAGKCKR